jgi:PmbA protein
MSDTSKERTMISTALSGANDTEIYYGTGRRLSIKAFRGEVASLTQSETAGASSRVIREKRTGSAFTERVTDEEIVRVIEMAERNAAYPEADEGNILYSIPSQERYDARKADFGRVPMERKRDVALTIEKAALNTDSRIVNVPYAFYGESAGSSVLGNTFGILQEYLFGYCYAYAYVMAKDGDDTQVGAHVEVGTRFEEIDAEAIGREAARKALARVGAVEPASGTYKVVFHEEAATELLGAFIAGGGSPFFGENLQKGRSKLKGKLGEVIGSDLFTLVDDPMSGLAPRPFDGEGVPTSTLTFVTEGVFNAEIHNLYSATRGGVKSTGHGSRGGSGGSIATSLHNPYLPDGDASFEGLLALAGDGILVTDVEGLHAGLDPISGDFSLSAKGFEIKGGIKGGPLKNMVVAGNFYELAKALAGKAADRRALSHEPFSSPSILIDGLAVSGS